MCSFLITWWDFPFCKAGFSYRSINTLEVHSPLRLELMPNFHSLFNICLLNQQFRQMDLKAYTAFFFFFKQNLLTQFKPLCPDYHLPNYSIPRNSPLPIDIYNENAKHTARLRSATASTSVVYKACSSFWVRWREILTFLLWVETLRWGLAWCPCDQ